MRGEPGMRRDWRAGLTVVEVFRKCLGGKIYSGEQECMVTEIKKAGYSDEQVEAFGKRRREVLGERADILSVRVLQGWF